MLFTYYIENLDLSIFKKHFTHYLSNMTLLGITTLGFRLHFGAYEIRLTTIKDDKLSNDCWIHFLLNEHNKPISFKNDSRFNNLELFHQIFLEEYDACGMFEVKNATVAANQICKLVNVIARIDKIKYFW